MNKFEDYPPSTFVFDEIMRWGEDQADEINFIWRLHGGWEGWAQVELAMTFGLFSSREDAAYVRELPKGIMKIDLGFKESSTMEGRRHSSRVRSGPEATLLELKCEGFNNRAKFKSGVEKDIEKIKGDIKKEWWEQGGCMLYSIALAMSEEGHRDMASLGMRSYFSDYGYEPPFQLWWTHRYIPPNHYLNKQLTPERQARYTKADEENTGYPLDSSDESDPYTSDEEPMDIEQVRSDGGEEDSREEDSGEEDSGEEDSGEEDSGEEDSGEDNKDVMDIEEVGSDGGEKESEKEDREKEDFY